MYVHINAKQNTESLQTCSRTFNSTLKHTSAVVSTGSLCFTARCQSARKAGGFGKAAEEKLCEAGNQNTSRAACVYV